MPGANPAPGVNQSPGSPGVRLSSSLAGTAHTAISQSSPGDPGTGLVHLSARPPTFQTMTYTYPLKLIAPPPVTVQARCQASSPNSVPERCGRPGQQQQQNHADDDVPVHTLFLLSYGGGLVAGDSISLALRLDSGTRLCLLTQGTTKVFKTPDARRVVTRQALRVRVGRGAALCYIPDAVQPFGQSAFEQVQRFELERGVDGGDGGGGLCVADWVCAGRVARGERWRFWRYGSRNEVWEVLVESEEGSDGRGVACVSERKRLLIRDNLVLDTEDDGIAGGTMADRVGSLGALGTLILSGGVFELLGTYFIDEFARLPRLGAKNWDGEVEEKIDEMEVRRRARQRQEAKHGVLWTASAVRGAVVVKFGAREVEGVKVWLRTMLRDEGTVEAYFGERALLCLN